jgi:hypothetical protein
MNGRHFNFFLFFSVCEQQKDRDEICFTRVRDGVERVKEIEKQQKKIAFRIAKQLN